MLNTYLSDSTLKLTDLRKDVLKIFIQSKKPISAYDVLKKLKKKRGNAEPPTVYRVIEYFIEKNIIHRIDTHNKYVLCSQADHQKFDKNAVLFICKKCQASLEVIDKPFANALKKLSSTHDFETDNTLLEITGICPKCVAPG